MLKPAFQPPPVFLGDLDILCAQLYLYVCVCVNLGKPASNPCPSLRLDGALALLTTINGRATDEVKLHFDAVAMG